MYNDGLTNNDFQNADVAREPNGKKSDRWLDVLLALLLLLPALPLIFLIGILVYSTDGRPVLYRGVRLGQGKRPFVMYKFRTLVRGADEIIGADLLSRRLAAEAKLEHRFGKFLRDTRLDELPQLFNVIKGDMSFFGPRPVRPEVYSKLCHSIPGYDMRFGTKPGLVGYSQVLTPHGSPKRIRSLIDNRFVRDPHRLGKSLWLIWYVFRGMMAHVVRGLTYGVATWVHTTPLLGGTGEHRKFERVPQKNARARFLLEDECQDCAEDEEGLVTDVSSEAIAVHTNSVLPDGEIKFRISKWFARRGSHQAKRKVAYCHGFVLRSRTLDEGPYRYAYVIVYAPASSLNEYRLHQYFLGESLT
jgi:lipopolysaccharide/colanic/teichoic acid biosynthesis glycosyltransferase